MNAYDIVVLIIVGLAFLWAVRLTIDKARRKVHLHHSTTPPPAEFLSSLQQPFTPVTNTPEEPAEFNLGPDGTYVFPKIPQGGLVSLAGDVEEGPEPFALHRDLFLKKILRRLAKREPRIEDYMRFWVHARGEEDIVAWDQEDVGRVTHRMVGAPGTGFLCEFLYSPLEVPEEPLQSPTLVTIKP